jgi:hypothetical protein
VVKDIILNLLGKRFWELRSICSLVQQYRGERTYKEIKINADYKTINIQFSSSYLSIMFMDFDVWAWTELYLLNLSF